MVIRGFARLLSAVADAPTSLPAAAVSSVFDAATDDADPCIDIFNLVSMSRSCLTPSADVVL